MAGVIERVKRKFTGDGQRHVRLLTSVATMLGSYQVGTTPRMSNEQADSLVAAGQAEELSAEAQQAARQEWDRVAAEHDASVEYINAELERRRIEKERPAMEARERRQQYLRDLAEELAPHLLEVLMPKITESILANATASE